MSCISLRSWPREMHLPNRFLSVWGPGPVMPVLGGSPHVSLCMAPTFPVWSLNIGFLANNNSGNVIKIQCYLKWALQYWVHTDIRREHQLKSACFVKKQESVSFPLKQLKIHHELYFLGREWWWICLKWKRSQREIQILRGLWCPFAPNRFCVSILSFLTVWKCINKI